MGFIYWVLQKFFKALTSLYFRKTHVVGLENIPEEGPVIICCNHSNQFIDAFMIGSIIKQQLSFTIAASSFQKPIIGKIAKAVKAIPVKRPEDSKKKSEGKLIFLFSEKIKLNNNESNCLASKKTSFIVKGYHTKFLQVDNEMEKGWSILVTNIIIPIKNVIDDETMEVLYVEDVEKLFDENDENKEYDFYVCKHYYNYYFHFSNSVYSKNR